MGLGFRAIKPKKKSLFQGPTQILIAFIRLPFSASIFSGGGLGCGADLPGVQGLGFRV